MGGDKLGLIWLRQEKRKNERMGGRGQQVKQKRKKERKKEEEEMRPVSKTGGEGAPLPFTLHFIDRLYRWKLHSFIHSLSFIPSFSHSFTFIHSFILSFFHSLYSLSPFTHSFSFLPSFLPIRAHNEPMHSPLRAKHTHGWNS